MGALGPPVPRVTKGVPKKKERERERGRERERNEEKKGGKEMEE